MRRSGHGQRRSGRARLLMELQARTSSELWLQQFKAFSAFRVKGAITTNPQDARSLLGAIHQQYHLQETLMRFFRVPDELHPEANFVWSLFAAFLVRDHIPLSKGISDGPRSGLCCLYLEPHSPIGVSGTQRVGPKALPERAYIGIRLRTGLLCDPSKPDPSLVPAFSESRYILL